MDQQPIVHAQGSAAIFLDRDGTLNIDNGYVGEVSRFQFIGGAIEACRQLQSFGYQLVLITNQSGIARGYFSEQQFRQLTAWMCQQLAQQGVQLAGFYYCPHHPQGMGQYRQYCQCRKPQPGLLLRAQQELNLDMASSYLVGDKWEDLQAAKAAGVGKRVLVKSGHPLTSQAKAQADWILPSLQALPDAITEASHLQFKES